MEKHEEVEIVLGIAIVYVIVTGIFSLLTRSVPFIVYRNNYSISSNFKEYIHSSVLFIVIVIAIILSLILYAKKLGQKISLNILNNKIVCISSGLLIIIQALIYLLSTLPANIVSIRSTFRTSQILGQAAPDGFIKQSIISLTISTVIYLCQIILGIYLAKFKSKNID